MSDSPQIQAIKERYKASFPEKIEILEGLKASAEQNQKLEIAKEELHKLAGSSGMYGYDDLSYLCRVGMRNVDQGDSNALLSTIDKIIDLLEQTA